MATIPTWAQSGPLLFVFLFVVVFCRAQSTYWLGRLAARGALWGQGREGIMGRIAAWFTGPTPRRGAQILERWGLIVIPLCFLTVGIQTAVNAGAGLVRLRWRTYTLAMIPGCIAWATMYGLGLLAMWFALARAVAGSPWAWGVITLILAAIGFKVLWNRRHRAQVAAVLDGESVSAASSCPAVAVSEAAN